jgi:hypothetical protein
VFPLGRIQKAFPTGQAFLTDTPLQLPVSVN